MTDTPRDAIEDEFLEGNFTHDYFDRIESLSENERLTLNSIENYYYDEGKKLVISYLRKKFPSMDAANMDSIFTKSTCWSNFLNIVRYFSLKDFDDDEEPNKEKSKEAFEAFIRETHELNQNVTNIDEFEFPSSGDDIFKSAFKSLRQKVKTALINLK